MRDYLLVLRAQLGTSRRTLGRGLRGARLLLLGLILAGGFAAFATRGVLSMFGGIRQALVEYPQLLPAVEQNLLTMWSLFVVAIVFSNALHTTFASLYGSEETGYLLSTPLNPQAVFAARLTSSIGGYVLFAVPAFAPFVAYGIVNAAGPGYYMTVGITYLAFFTFLVAVASLFITAVMAFVPGVRLKQWLLVLGLAIGLGMVFGSQLVATGIGGGNKLLALLERIGGYNLTGFTVLPHVWLVRTAQSAVGGAGYGWALLTAGLSAATFALLVLFAGRVYTIGWAAGQEEQRRRPRPVSSRRRGLSGIDAAGIPPGRSPFATPFWAIARKDLLTGLRTPLMWYLVLVGAVVVTFQVINLMRSTAGQPPSSGTAIILLSFVSGGASFSGFVYAGSAFSREGGNFSLLSSWPVSTAALFAGKVAATLPVSVTVGIVGLVIVGHVAPGILGPFWRNLPVLVSTLVPALSLMALLDTLFPDFSFERGFQPGSRGSASTVVKTLVSLYSGIGIVVVLTIAFYFGSYYSRFKWASGLSAAQARMAGYALHLVAATVLTAASFLLGAPRLRTLGQQARQTADRR